MKNIFLIIIFLLNTDFIYGQYNFGNNNRNFWNTNNLYWNSGSWNWNNPYWQWNPVPVTPIYPINIWDKFYSNQNPYIINNYYYNYNYIDNKTNNKR